MTPFCVSDFLKSGAIVSVSADRLLLGWGKRRSLPAEELDSRGPSFYISDFFLETRYPWVQYDSWAEMSIQSLTDALGIVLPSCTCDWNLLHPERFSQAFDQLQVKFQQQELQKAVPYLFAVSPNHMSEERFKVSLRRGLNICEKQAGHLYGHWNEEKGVLGVTPEWLFCHANSRPQQVRTMALAGTCHPSQSQEAFFDNDKEREEHQWVVQGICQALHEMGVVRLGAMQLFSLPKLTHLMTPIELTLNRPFHFEALVNCLHPTPAVGALPFVEGKKWLKTYDAHTPRGYYGAPFGFFDPQRGLSNCLVGIRNVQWSVGGMRIGAGCGIVQRSRFEKEWQEIGFKIRAIRDQLHL